MPSEVDVYMYPHLGLGDSLMVNGMVRYFCSRYNNLVLFCSTCYCKSIKWLYRDIKNLNIMPFGSDLNSTGDADHMIREFIQANNLYDKLFFLGHYPLSQVADYGLYHGYYKIYDLDPFMRFDNFYYERNFEYEDYVFDQLNPNKEKYIFVIDDSRHHLGNFVISNEKIGSEYKIIHYNKELNFDDDRFLMFNYYKILENAEEIHTLETAFFEFIQLIKLPKPKIYIHSYKKRYIDSEKDWNFFLSKHTNNYTFLYQ